MIPQILVKCIFYDKKTRYAILMTKYWINMIKITMLSYRAIDSILNDTTMV